MSHLMKVRLSLLKIKLIPTIFNEPIRFNSSSASESFSKYKLLIVGGGTGGTGIAHKYTRTLKNDIALIEPSDVHFYQPMFTLVGGGLKKFTQTHTSTQDVLPKGCKWIKSKAIKFDPENNTVFTDHGEKIKYDYLLVAAGVKLNLQKVKGLEDALENDPNVVSIYSKDYVKKVFPAVENLQSGTAVFTFPNTPVKCAGAAQKICYLSEENLKKAGKRGEVDVHYITSLPALFGIPKYSLALDKLVEERDIKVSKKLNLVEVKSALNEAVFQEVGNEDNHVTVKYSMLHVTPPMEAPKEIKESPLCDHSGFIDVNPHTLQHSTYPNVFGIGDCINAPTAKTAAAIASQIAVVNTNLWKVMKGKECTRKYDGYTSCPLVVNSKQAILAEFGYDGKVLETFPFDQSKPRLTMYWLKAHAMPFLYWNFLIKGLWHGPGLIRKMWRLGF